MIMNAEEGFGGRRSMDRLKYNHMKPDSEGMEENAKKRLKKKQKTLTDEFEQSTELTLKKISSLWKSFQVDNGTTYIQAKSIKKGAYQSISTTAFNGFDILGGQIDANAPMQDAHTNKGICQESYDQGYEDGLKASKEGDTRIK